MKKVYFGVQARVQIPSPKPKFASARNRLSLGLFIINNVFLPEVLAGDVPAEVPCDALGADKGEYLGVIMIRELQVPGQKCHRWGVTRFLKLNIQAQGPQVHFIITDTILSIIT